MSTGVVIECGIALFATAMDGDSGWYDLSMGLDMVTATVFWLKFCVFDVFGNPWWNQGFSDGESTLASSRCFWHISCRSLPRIPWFFQRCWLRHIG